MLTVVECSGSNSAFHGKISCGFKRKVVEITPSAVCRDYNLCMVGKVELNMLTVHQTNRMRDLPESDHHKMPSSPHPRISGRM
jgi:hypothetical protein